MSRSSPSSSYPWSKRRVAIFWTIALCSGGLIYLTGWGSDTKLNETLATVFGVLLGSTIGSYVFGAAWHDRGLMEAVTRRTELPPTPSLTRDAADNS